MITLLKTELFKILKRPRTYIGFGAILFIVVALELAFFAEGETLVGMAMQNLQSVFRLEGKIISVNFLTYMLLNVLNHSCQPLRHINFHSAIRTLHK